MNTFLGPYNPLRLNYIEIENLNKPVIINRKDIESVIKYLPPENRLLHWWILKILKELPKIFLKLFSKKLKSREYFQIHCMRSSPCYQSQKKTTRKGNYRSICLMNIVAKIFNKTVANKIQQHLFFNHTPDQVVIFLLSVRNMEFNQC